MQFLTKLFTKDRPQSEEQFDRVLFGKSALPDEPPQRWNLFEEGQLRIDMYEREDAIIVRALVAGVDPQDLEVSMHNDLLTIRGVRQEFEEVHLDKYFHRECYWGAFSRSVIIPIPVNQQDIRACIKNGIIYIELPKFVDERSCIPLEVAREPETPGRDTT